MGNLRKSNLIIALYVAAALCSPATVFAHRMLITPEEEGVVFVGYDDGTPSVGAGVTLYDAGGEEIVSGTTDQQGRFRFDPAHSPVRIVSDDGMGHRAVWKPSSGGGGIETLPRWAGGLLGAGFFLFIAALFYYINVLKNDVHRKHEN